MRKMLLSEISDINDKAAEIGSECNPKLILDPFDVTPACHSNCSFCLVIPSRNIKLLVSILFQTQIPYINLVILTFQLTHSLKDEFIKSYRAINHNLWKLYRRNLISKADLSIERFRRVMQKHSFESPNVAEIISHEYLELSPTFTGLCEGTHEILHYLKDKYQLHIMTNGFKEVQVPKLKNSKLDAYFEHVFISEEIGYKKPDKRIYEYALRKTQATIAECIMIGDDQQSDIAGAKGIGMDQVLFNPKKEKIEVVPRFEIRKLAELRTIL